VDRWGLRHALRAGKMVRQGRTLPDFLKAGTALGKADAAVEIRHVVGEEVDVLSGQALHQQVKLIIWCVGDATYELNK